jgi:hypothetical protein
MRDFEVKNFCLGNYQIRFDWIFLSVRNIILNCT